MTHTTNAHKVYTLAANPGAARPTERFAVPVHGAQNPGAGRATTPGSFANAPDIGGPLMFSSPDTPGMPAPSPYTAWDFLPNGWTIQEHPQGCRGHNQGASPIIAVPAGEKPLDPSVAPALRRSVAFSPVTQLEHARLGIITPEMRRVAEREAHTSPPSRSAMRSPRDASSSPPTRSTSPTASTPWPSAAPARPRSTPTWAPPPSPAAPRRNSRSSTGPSAGAPTPSWTSPPAATSTPAARPSSDTPPSPSAPSPSTR
jgi:hypothetical protein